MPLPPPVFGWPAHVQDFDRPGVPSQKTFLARLHQARVFGPAVAVASSRDLLLKEISVEWSPRFAPWPMRKFRLAEPRRLAGRSLLLASTGGENYYHFLHDILPRLALVREAGMLRAEFQHYVVNDLRPPFVRELLEKSGVPLSLCIETFVCRHLWCEELLVPSLPGELGSPHAGIGRFYGELYPPPPRLEPAKRRGIFLSRPPARQRALQSADTVFRILEEFQVEVVELGQLPVSAQAEKVRSAAFIVAPHGAALANLVFCFPGTPVLEIFAPVYINQCYRVLAAMRGLPYAYLVGTRVGGKRGRNRRGDASGDIVLDPSAFRQALQNLRALSRTPASAG